MFKKIIPLFGLAALSGSALANTTFNQGYSKGKAAAESTWNANYNSNCARLQEFKDNLFRLKLPAVNDYNRGHNAGTDGALAEVRRGCNDNCQQLGQAEGRLFGELFCSTNFAAGLKTPTSCGSPAFSACVQAYGQYVDQNCYQKQLDEPEKHVQFLDTACNAFLP